MKDLDNFLLDVFVSRCEEQKTGELSGLSQSDFGLADLLKAPQQCSYFFSQYPWWQKDLSSESMKDVKFLFKDRSDFRDVVVEQLFGKHFFSHFGRIDSFGDRQIRDVLIKLSQSTAQTSKVNSGDQVEDFFKSLNHEASPNKSLSGIDLGKVTEHLFLSGQLSMSEKIGLYLALHFQKVEVHWVPKHLNPADAGNLPILELLLFSTFLWRKTNRTAFSRPSAWLGDHVSQIDIENNFLVTSIFSIIESDEFKSNDPFNPNALKFFKDTLFQIQSLSSLKIFEDCTSLTKKNQFSIIFQWVYGESFPFNKRIASDLRNWTLVENLDFLTSWLFSNLSEYAFSSSEAFFILQYFNPIFKQPESEYSSVVLLVNFMHVYSSVLPSDEKNYVTLFRKTLKTRLSDIAAWSNDDKKTSLISEMLETSMEFFGILQVFIEELQEHHLTSFLRKEPAKSMFRKTLFITESALTQQKQVSEFEFFLIFFTILQVSDKYETSRIDWFSKAKVIATKGEHGDSSWVVIQAIKRLLMGPLPDIISSTNALVTLPGFVSSFRTALGSLIFCKAQELAKGELSLSAILELLRFQTADVALIREPVDEVKEEVFPGKFSNFLLKPLASDEAISKLCFKQGPTTDVKCVFVGDANSMKTRLLIAYSNIGLPTHRLPTLFESLPTNIEIGDITAVMSLNDAAYQEEYDRLRRLSYYEANVMVLACNVCSGDSLERIQRFWIPEIQQQGYGEVPLILVGTETHLRDDPMWASKHPDEDSPSVSGEVVPTRKGRRVAKSLGAVAFLECSTATMENVETLFQLAARVAAGKNAKINSSSSSSSSSSGAKKLMSDFFSALGVRR